VHRAIGAKVTSAPHGFDRDNPRWHPLDVSTSTSTGDLWDSL